MMLALEHYHFYIAMVRRMSSQLKSSCLFCCTNFAYKKLVRYAFIRNTFSRSHKVPYKLTLLYFFQVRYIYVNKVFFFVKYQVGNSIGI